MGRGRGEWGEGEGESERELMVSERQRLRLRKQLMCEGVGEIGMGDSVSEVGVGWRRVSRWDRYGSDDVGGGRG